MNRDTLQDIPAKDVTAKERKAIQDHLVMPVNYVAGIRSLMGKLNEGQGIRTGYTELDKLSVATQPGWIRLWLANLGTGKTTIAKMIARREAQRLVDSGNEKGYILYIAYEDQIESIALSLVEHTGFQVTDLFDPKTKPELRNQFADSALSLSKGKIWFFGESETNAYPDKPAMTLDQILMAIDASKKLGGAYPTLIVADYLQEIVIADEPDNRVRRMITGYQQLMKAASYLGVPVELFAQANRDAQHNHLAMPQVDNVEWSNYPAQKAATVISFSKPYLKPGKREPRLKIDGKEYANAENLIIFQQQKSRYGKAMRDYVPFRIDHDKMILETVSPLTTYDSLDF